MPSAARRLHAATHQGRPHSASTQRADQRGI